MQASRMRLAAFALCRVASMAHYPAFVAPLPAFVTAGCPFQVTARAFAGGNGRSSLKQQARLASPAPFRSVNTKLQAPRAAGDASADASADGGWADGTHTFLCDVFIEDTDCYQVVYNANYAKFCDRARQAAAGVDSLARLESEGVHMQLVLLTDHKLKAAAKLGSQLKVETFVEATHADSGLIRWRQEVVDFDSGTVFATAQTLTRFVASDGSALSPETCVSAMQTITAEARQGAGWGDQGVPVEAGYEKLATIEGADVRWFEGTDVMYADEFDSRRRISDISVLRCFERNRNIALGGSSGLLRIQDDGVLIVVVGFSDVRMDLTQNPPLGAPVLHRSTVQQKKAKLDFQQEMWLPGALTPFASGKVTCLCIDAKSKRLTPPPEWVQKRAEGVFLAMGDR